MYEDEWNKDLQPHYSESVYFSNKNPNSLELNRIVILTQSRTASASELVINSLNPYVDVLQVGMDTRGKYQGSVLVYDSPNFSNKNRNPLHRYAMLPLVLKTKNSIGFTDFDEGLPADVFFEEKVGHFQNNLGTTEEPLLRTALEALGFSLPQAKTSDKLILLEVQDYDKALDNIMYLEAIE